MNDSPSRKKDINDARPLVRQSAETPSLENCCSHVRQLDPMHRCDHTRGRVKANLLDDGIGGTFVLVHATAGSLGAPRFFSTKTVWAKKEPFDREAPATRPSLLFPP